MRRTLLALILCGLAQAAPAQWASVDTTARRLAQGTVELPAALRHHWRATLVFALSTGALIAFADAPASRRIDSPSLERWSQTWSNRGLLLIEPAMVIGITGIKEKCVFCPPMAHMALTTLTAEAYTAASVQTLKFAAGRERPFPASDGDGGFNESGSSFPSGHAAGAFTMAAVLAHEFPDTTWTGASGYAVAAGVSALRFTGKEHFPSDLLVGAAIGVLTGRCALQCRQDR